MSCVVCLGSKWYEVMPGNPWDDLETQMQERDLGGSPDAAREHWGAWSSKLETVLLVAVPAKANRNPARVLPGRSDVRTYTLVNVPMQLSPVSSSLSTTLLNTFGSNRSTSYPVLTVRRVSKVTTTSTFLRSTSRRALSSNHLPMPQGSNHARRHSAG